MLRTGLLEDKEEGRKETSMVHGKAGQYPLCNYKAARPLLPRRAPPSLWGSHVVMEWLQPLALLLVVVRVLM